MQGVPPIRPFQYQLLPRLTDDEFAALKDDILTRGVMVPIEKDEHGNILDGYHRAEICAEIGIDPPVLIRTGMSHEEKVQHALSLNLTRRHLSADQRRELVARLRAEGWSYRRIGERLNVDHTTVMRGANSGGANAPPEPDKIIGKDGKSYPTVLVTGRREEQRVNKALQSTFAGSMTTGATEKIITGAEAIKSIREAERKDFHRQLDNYHTPISALDGKYVVLYADPPWRYEHAISDNRQIENQYPTMALDEIAELPIQEIANDDSILFMWGTSPKLVEALQVMSAWGFTYRTCMVWVKDRIGMGYYARQQHELLLIGVRGEPPTPRPENRPSSVLNAPRGNHSEKPAEMAQLIERMYPNAPRVELFCRVSRPGWAVWGNQA